MRVFVLCAAFAALILYIGMAWVSWASYHGHRRDYPKYANERSEAGKLLATLCSPAEQKKDFWSAVSGVAGGFLMIPLLVAVLRRRGLVLQCLWSYWLMQSSVVFLLKKIPEGNALWIILPSIVILSFLVDLASHLRQPPKVPAPPYS